MASFKITDLTELAAVDVADADLLEIVDFDADQSKKVSIQSLKTVFSGSPAGSDTQIQFNDGGSFGADAGLTFDDTTSTLSVGKVGQNGHIGLRRDSNATEIGSIYVTSGSFNLRENQGSGGQLQVYDNTLALHWRRHGANDNRVQINPINNNPFDATFQVNLRADTIGQLINLANGQTADAFQINSYGNTGGDLYAIEGDGKIRSMIAAANTISQTHFNFPNAYSITNLSTLTANKYSAFFGHYTGTKHQGLYIGVNSTGAGFIQNIDGTSAYRFSIQPYGGGLTVGSTTGMPNNKTLEVNGDSYFNGNVGIGTSSPTAKLHEILSTDQVGYRLDLSNGQTADAFQINSYGNTGGDLFRVEDDGKTFVGVSSAYNASFQIGSIVSSDYLFRVGDSCANLGGGSVMISGVGTTTNNILLLTDANRNIRFYQIDNGRAGFTDTGTSFVSNSALLELNTTTRGFLPPRMTTTQRDAISSPATGLLIFNTTTVKLEYYSGTAWGQV